MLNWKFRAQAALVITSIFTITQVQAADWGRIASGIAGSYAGAYVAERAGGDTLTQITAGMVGSHLAVRAYDAYQSRRTSNNYEPRYVEEEHGYSYPYYYDTNPPASYQPSKEQIEKEYSDFRQDNEKIIALAKEDLVEKIKSIQSQADASWICASICAKFNDYRLKATPIVSSAKEAQAAYNQLNQACPKDYVFTDGLADNAKGTQTIVLKQSQLVCFPNSVSVEQSVAIAKDSDQKMKVRFSINDMDLKVNSGKNPSRKFIFEALDQLNDPNMVMITSGQASMADVTQKAESGSLKEQIDTISKNLGPAQMRDGALVIESKLGTPQSQFMRITVRGLTQFKTQAVMEMPITVKHKCGDESGRVSVSAIIEMGQIGEKPQMSDRLIDLNLKAASYSSAATDEFCK